MSVEIPLFKPVLLRASAGTGKTFQLSVRYLALVARGEDPARILATTFTRKAAGEIFERVLSRVARAVVSDKDRRELAIDIGLPDWSKSAAAELLTKLVREQHRLRICTLDSLFFSLASVFALELGLPPRFQIAAPELEHRDNLELIRLLLRTGEVEQFVQLIRKMNPTVFSRQITDPLLTKVREFFSVYRETEQAAWHWIRPPALLPKDRFAAACETLESYPVPLTKSKPIRPNSIWSKALDRMIYNVHSNQWSKFLAQTPVRAASIGVKYNRDFIPADLAEILDPLIRHGAAIVIARLKEQTEASYEFLSHFAELYAARTHERGSLTFEDAKLILAQGAIEGRLDDLYFRLDSQIRHLLFDEFQDTSMTQWQVLQPIADEIMSKAGADGTNTFFCVGDVKQAIYGWRGGVADIFDSLERRWPGQLVNCPMDQTRRCAPAVLEAVNGVFGSIAESKALEEFPEAAAAWGLRFAEHEALEPPRLGHVQLIQSEATEEKAGVPELQRAASIAQDLLRQNPGISIGILLRRNKTVKRMLHQLRRPEIGIHASEESGNPITDSPAILAVASLLQLLDHPGNTVLRYHVASSPLGEQLGLTDWESEDQIERVLPAARRAIGQLGLGGYLNQLRSLLGPALSERDRFRFGQLIELALSGNYGSTGRFDEFVDLLERQRREDPSASAVRVMTIHASKGLEFDAVILPELGTSPGDSRKPEVLVYRDSPTEPPSRVSVTPPKDTEHASPELTEMTAQYTNSRMMESLCVLYVAMTRARHGLYMITANKTGSDHSMANILLKALGGKPDTRGVRFETGDAQWTDKVKAEMVEPAPETTPRSALQLKAPAGRRLRGLPRVAPSALEGGTLVDIGLTLQVAPSAAARRGRALHALFETVAWIEDERSPETESQSQLSRLGLDSAAQAQLIGEFTELCGKPGVCSVFERGRYLKVDELKLYREQRFALREGDQLLNGSVDRLVVSYRDGAPIAAEVIDFKTDILTDDSLAIEQRVDYYRPQLEAYRRAASKLTGLDLDSITATILFLSLDRVVKVV